MKVVTIIQARTTSSRLPNKVMFDIYGKSLLERVIDQAKKIENSDELWVATSTHENDDVVEILCERKKVLCHRGSLENVRDRFYNIAKKTGADIILRITADNPLTEPAYAIQLIDVLKSNYEEYDYVRMKKSSILSGTLSEAFTIQALEKSVSEYNDSENIEHVVPAIVNHMKVLETVPMDKDLVAEKTYFVGVDTFEDFKRATKIFKEFGEHDTLKQLIKKVNKNGKAI